MRKQLSPPGWEETRRVEKFAWLPVTIVEHREDKPIILWSVWWENYLSYQKWDGKQWIETGRKLDNFWSY